MSAPTTFLRLVDGDRAVAFLRFLEGGGCPATVDGLTVTFPCDQPGYVMHVVDDASTSGSCTDAEGAACIGRMSDALSEAEGDNR